MTGENPEYDNGNEGWFLSIIMDKSTLSIRKGYLQFRQRIKRNTK